MSFEVLAIELITILNNNKEVTCQILLEVSILIFCNHIAHLWFGPRWSGGGSATAKDCFKS